MEIDRLNPFLNSHGLNLKIDSSCRTKLAKRAPEAVLSQHRPRQHLHHPRDAEAGDDLRAAEAPVLQEDLVRAVGQDAHFQQPSHQISKIVCAATLCMIA